MAILSEEYQNYFAVDKSGLVPSYHIPLSLPQTSTISTMPLSTDKALGLVGKTPHFSPVPLSSAFWQEPNTETRLQCLDHLAAAAAGIKISPNMYSSHNPLSSASPGISSIQPAPGAYNPGVLEKLYFQHQQDKLQLKYQQRQLAAQDEQKVSLLNPGHPSAATVPQIGLFSTPARPSPRLPITQYLYNMYGSKYRYANPVVLQQYQGMPGTQEQWTQQLNGIQKNLDPGTFEKTIRDRNNPSAVSLQSPFKSPNEMVLPVNPTPKHPSSLVAQSHVPSSDTVDPIDIDKLSTIGLTPPNSTTAACGGPQNSCLHPDSCLPCTEANRLLYNFCKTSNTQNSQKCKDTCNSNFSSSTNSSNGRNLVKNNGPDSTNCCISNGTGSGSNKNNSLPMSRPDLSGDYPSSYPSIHPNLWPSTSTSSSPPLYTTQLPTQTSFPLPASSPTGTFYPYANMRNDLGDLRNSIYGYGIDDPMTRMSRPRGIFSTRYHPFDRERRI